MGGINKDLKKRKKRNEKSFNSSRWRYAAVPENEEYFIQAYMDNLLGEPLWTFLKKADYRIFNLEGHLIKREAPIWKDRSMLGATVETAVGIKAMQADLLSLANNHIMDGEEGLINILETLRSYDYIMVIYHGMREFYQYPSPKIRDIF